MTTASAVRDIARRRLARERGFIVKDWGGRIPVAFVYPNSYFIGMSNLAVQTVYSLFNAYPDVVCERAFYDPPADAPHPAPVVSLESQRPLGDFAVLAFTLSYELDYYNLVQALKSAGIPLRAEERDERHPLVIAGGACMLTNPAPVAPFLDVAVVGEGEEVIPSLVAAWRDGLFGSRAELLDQLAGIDGLYVPQRPPAGGSVERVWVHDIAQTEAHSTVLTEDTELSNMTLIEVARGCGRGCRFCIAGYVFRPPRYRPLEALLGVVEHSLRHTERVGLLGAAVADHPQLPELVLGATALGARVSISSLRVDNLRPEVLRAIADGGTKTVTVAPEAGSERMRLAINKGVTEEQILHGAELVGASGAARFKLYFMIGLPGEEDEDVHAMAQLGNRVKQRLDAAGHGTRLVMAVSPLVPKPWTAYQYQPQAPAAVIKQRQALLKQQLASGIEFRTDSPRTARVDDVLSRGDARVADLLEALPEPSLGAYHRAFREHGLDGDFPWQGERPPWQIVDVGMTERFLLREMDKHERLKSTIPCPPPAVGCKLCGVC